MVESRRLSCFNKIGLYNSLGLLVLYYVAPVGIMHQIAYEVRKFIWQVGKLNTKKFHLVNWKTLRAPKDRGGLAIKDSSLMKLAQGANIIWRMITGRLE